MHMLKEKQVEISFVRHYKLTEHTCPVCETVFQAPRLRIYCSLECKQKAAWSRHGAEWNENKKRRRNVQDKVNQQEGSKK